jgi:DeoR/GlpR family transcriptional regulator of sugar metabolism
MRKPSAAADTIVEVPFPHRADVNRAEKAAIARAAAPLLLEGQTCFVDAGTTTALLAAELARVPGLTVITNSLQVATCRQAMRPQDETILLGGRLLSAVPATYGDATVAEIVRYAADIAILSAVGVSAALGATNYLTHEAEVARAMVARSRRTMLLADHSKIGAESRVQFCPCSRIDVLVTDEAADAAVLAALRAAGVGSIVRGAR